MANRAKNSAIWGINAEKAADGGGGRGCFLARAIRADIADESRTERCDVNTLVLNLPVPPTMFEFEFIPSVLLLCAENLPLFILPLSLTLLRVLKLFPFALPFAAFRAGVRQQ